MCDDKVQSASATQIPPGADDAGSTSKPDPSKFIASATDLNSLNDALTNAAGISSALWLSYVVLLSYLMLGAGGVTAQDLFYETQVKLPFLSVDLPIKGFFWLGPTLFLIVHVYVLLHFVMLSDKVDAFNTQFRQQITDPNTAEQLRGQLPLNVFVQLLAGPDKVQHGLANKLLWSIALISLAIGPIALMVFFELKFLAYHSEFITWVQRILTLFDAVLVCWAWPTIGRRSPRPAANKSPPRHHIQLYFTTPIVWVWSAVGIISVLYANFPGEWLHHFLQKAHVTAADQDFSSTDNNSSKRRLNTFFPPNVLVLPYLGVIDRDKYGDETKRETLPAGFSLRGRHLEGAVLNEARLEEADLNDAFLTGANLYKAHLQNADLRNAHLDRADLIQADLQGASLNEAWLRGAKLGSAQMQGASLSKTQLQGADLGNANLDAAKLTETKLEGASLDHASFQGADLNGLYLQAADLSAANFSGDASLRACLDGTLLDHTYLANVSLEQANIYGADPKNTNAMFCPDTSIPPTRMTAAFILNPNLQEFPQCNSLPESASDGPSSPPCVQTKLNTALLRKYITDQVPAGDGRVAALKLIDISLSGGAQQSPAVWLKKNTVRPSADFDNNFVAQWHRIGCTSGTQAPYVIEGMVRTISGRQDNKDGFLSSNDTLVKKLAEAFLTNCDGARSITADTLAKLNQLRKN